MQTIETKRLILREFRFQDAFDVFVYAKRDDVGPHAGWKPHESIEETERIVASFIASEEVWAIQLKDNNKVIGSIGLHQDELRNSLNSRSIGYVVSPFYKNKGYAKEAVLAIVHHAFFDLNIHMVSGYHFPNNYASKRVLLTCGFKYEGTIKNAIKLYDGQLIDRCCYIFEKEKFTQRHI